MMREKWVEAIVKSVVENQCQKSAEKGALNKHFWVKKLVRSLLENSWKVVKVSLETK